MQYVSRYASPLGDLLLAADDGALCGAWFAGQKHFANGLDQKHEEKEVPVLTAAREWLSLYFGGKKPDWLPPLHFSGTPFQKEVWEILCTIPWGETITYGQIASLLPERNENTGFLARSVGGAVARNRISIFVPCHRVVGAGGNLTGYAGGLERKIALLKLEGAWKETFR